LEDSVEIISLIHCMRMLHMSCTMGVAYKFWFIWQHCHTVVRSSLQLSATQCLIWRRVSCKFGILAPRCCPSMLLQSEWYLQYTIC